MRTRPTVGFAILSIMAMLGADPGGARAEDAEDPGALNRQTVQLFGQRKYAEATVLGRQALALAERVLGGEHPDTLQSINNLAALYKAQGLYGEAEPLYKRILETRERLLGQEHADTLASVANLGIVYRSEERYGVAEALLKRALEAQERILGGEHPDTLRSVCSLAALYRALGHGPSEPLFQRALEAQQRVLGAEHPGTLATIDGLAMLYEGQGRYDEAEPLRKRALEARERVSGKGNNDTLLSVDNLVNLYKRQALIYASQGKHDKAGPPLVRALEVRERLLGKTHSDTLLSVSHLADYYKTQGRAAEAKALTKRLKAAREAPSAETVRLQKALIGCWKHVRSGDEPGFHLACFNAEGVERGVTFDAGDGWDWSIYYSLENNRIFNDGYFWASIQKVDDHKLIIETDREAAVYELVCRTEQQGVQCERLK